MDVYLLILGDHLPDPTTGRAVSEADRLRAVVEQAVVAEEAGFTGVAIGEHHFTRYIVSAPELLLASIAARTTRLRLSTGVTLLAHHDPVRVAEELATLDVLSSGRAELIVARGVSQRTDAAFGVQDDLRARFEENLRLLLTLLERPRVTWRGRFRSPLVDVTTVPRPVQRPRPTVWIGSGSAVSADLGVELGLPLMLPSTLRDPGTHRAVVERYRAALGGRGRVALPSHVFVAPTSAGARRVWRPHLTAYAHFADPWRGDGDVDVDVDALMEGAAVCGDPAEVTERLNGLGKLLGLDAHLVMVDIGGLPHAAVLEAIRLFGQEVLPRLTA